MRITLDVTGLYYLNARYYDPQVGRFINADTSSILGVSPGSANNDKNLYTYCDNNPIVRADDGGELWNFIIGGIVGGVVGGLSAAFNGGSTTDIIIGSLAGIGTGLISASGLGFLTQAGLCSAIGAGKSIVTQFCDIQFNGKRFSDINLTKRILDIGKSAFEEGALSLIGSGAGKLINKVTKCTGLERHFFDSYLEKSFSAGLRKSVGKSSSSLLRQAAKFLSKANFYQNVGRGVSSVAGSLISGIKGMIL